jgi:hypothetical protein
MAGLQFQKLQTSIEYAFYAFFTFSEIIFLSFYLLKSDSVIAWCICS